VNKHLGPPVNCQRIIDSLEAAGVRTHIYSIMAFPTETLEEIALTKEFLIGNVRRHPYVTVSANIFHLMRGSVMARDPGAFGISETQDEGDVRLVLGFTEDQRQRNEQFAFEASREIYRAVFLPHADDPWGAEAFWHFIDQTGIFYLQKVSCRNNPYHELANSALEPLPANYETQLYKRSRLYALETASTENECVICDWVTNNYAQLPRAIVPFLMEYDEREPLYRNLELLVPTNVQQIAREAFPDLVRAGFFCRVGMVSGKPDDHSLALASASVN